MGEAGTNSGSADSWVVVVVIFNTSNKSFYGYVAP